MNFGAARASGDVLLFLHADCILPDNGFTLIRDSLSNGNVAAGAFSLRIDYSGLGFRLIESVSNIRSSMTSLIYGDQGMFLRKEMFDYIGGFAGIPLMEDIEISRRLRKEGKIVFIKPPITVSPRRWLKEGMIYTTLRDWTIAFSYTFFKISPERLIKHYKEVR
jgi:GT2 family glycosyltransferase